MNVFYCYTLKRLFKAEKLFCFDVLLFFADEDKHQFCQIIYFIYYLNYKKLRTNELIFLTIFKIKINLKLNKTLI
jgi:hypothetical protein